MASRAALWLEALVACGVVLTFVQVTASTAHALCITNASDWNLRVHFYRPQDKAMATALKRLEVDTSKAATWDAGGAEGDTFTAQIFMRLQPSQPAFDQTVGIEQVGRVGSYIFVKEGGRGKLYDLAVDASKLSSAQKRASKCK
jgi:hypothetical protein